MADHGIKIWNENLQGSNLTTWPETPYYAAGEYLTADKMNTALRNATIGVKVFYDAIQSEAGDSLSNLDYKLPTTGDDYTNCVQAVNNALTSKISGLSATSGRRGTVKLGYTFDKNNKYLYPVTSVDDGTNIAVDLSNANGIINLLESTINAATPDKTANTLVKRDASGMVYCDVTGNLTGNVTGKLIGNADTATKLATARDIQIDLSSTVAKSFDGTADITPGVAGVLNVINGGTGKSNLDDVVVGKAKKISTSAAIGNTAKPVYVDATGKITTIKSKMHSHSAGYGLAIESDIRPDGNDDDYIYKADLTNYTVLNKTASADATLSNTSNYDLKSVQLDNQGKLCVALPNDIARLNADYNYFNGAVAFAEAGVFENTLNVRGTATFNGGVSIHFSNENVDDDGYGDSEQVLTADTSGVSISSTYDNGSSTTTDKHVFPHSSIPYLLMGDTKRYYGLNPIGLNMNSFTTISMESTIYADWSRITDSGDNFVLIEIKFNSNFSGQMYASTVISSQMVKESIQNGGLSVSIPLYGSYNIGLKMMPAGIMLTTKSADITNIALRLRGYKI